MLKKELLDILCCPVCKGGLRYDKRKMLLTCKACRRTYTVADDIPIMLVQDDSTK